MYIGFLLSENWLDEFGNGLIAIPVRSASKAKWTRERCGPILHRSAWTRWASRWEIHKINETRHNPLLRYIRLHNSEHGISNKDEDWRCEFVSRRNNVKKKSKTQSDLHEYYNEAFYWISSNMHYHVFYRQIKNISTVKVIGLNIKFIRLFLGRSNSNFIEQYMHQFDRWLLIVRHLSAFLGDKAIQVVFVGFQRLKFWSCRDWNR